MRLRRDLETTYRTGIRRRAGGITVIAAPGAPGPPRVAVVAGRRVGSAVRRNRARRRIRAALERVPLRDDVAYIVIAGPDVVTVRFGRLVEWIEVAVKRLAGMGPGEEET